MNKQLFFDDNLLFSIENAMRKYGDAFAIGEYCDSACSTDLCTGHVFKLDNGTYRMLYFAYGKAFQGRKKLFSAKSTDGISFAPEDLTGRVCPDGKMFAHEIMDIPDGGEVVYVYEDNHTDKPDERYKMLMSVLDGKSLYVNDPIYVSGDLLNWKRKENVRWGNGAEPLGGVFYNSREGVHTILQRPFWGVRRVGYKETRDWESFTEYRDCLNADAYDQPLAEIYGMFAFEYDGHFIGLPHIYRNVAKNLGAKYAGGIIDTQLAYSKDGRYWQRSLREPFISGSDRGIGMTWVTDMKVDEGGDIRFYGSASYAEHGMNSVDSDNSGKIFIYGLRKDGFVSVSTKDKSIPTTVATREKLWHGGELHVNIKAKKATVAVYISEPEDKKRLNIFGEGRPIEGFAHEDCMPFCGDSKDWIPVFKSNKSFDSLKGKTVIFEIKFEDGDLYSISGDFTDLFNTEAARYRILDILP